VSPESAIDPAHAVALAGRATIADKIRYACEHVDPPTTLEVQQWLDTYGVTTARSYASNVIDTWRREHQVGDTGDLVALSPGLLAELDALRTGSGGTDGSAAPGGTTGANGSTATNGSATNGSAAATSANGSAATNGSTTNGSAAANGSAAGNGSAATNGSTGGKKAKRLTGAAARSAAAKAARDAAKNGATDSTTANGATAAGSGGAVVERSDEGGAAAPGVDTLADKDSTENMDTAVESGRADAPKADAEDATQIFEVDPAKRAAADEDSPTLVTFTPVRDDADTAATVEANTVEPDLSWLDQVEVPGEAGKGDTGKDGADKAEVAAAAATTEAGPEERVGKDLVVAEAPEPPAEPVTAHAERMAAPVDPEPLPPALPRVPVVLSWSANMAWIVVLIAAMGISWWSLFEYARGFSIPTPLAAVVSLVFDASALIVAGLAHRYALSPYSGAGPRIALLLLLAGSVYLNWEHAAGKGYGIEASIMFAAPAAVGILLFELHIGWHSRSERRARGRVARSLPVIGAWGWFLHPLQSITTLWRVTHARGRSVRTAELTSIDQSR